MKTLERFWLRLILWSNCYCWPHTRFLCNECDRIEDARNAARIRKLRNMEKRLNELP